MSQSSGEFTAFSEKMKAAGIPELAIENFRDYFQRLRLGETGLIPEETIVPVKDLPDSDELAVDLREVGRELVPHTVVIKLNGGLGTSMGLSAAKSLLKVKEDLTFLDVIVKQARFWGSAVVLMNSFATRVDSLEVLKRYGNLSQGLPADFVQHRVPKISQVDFQPARSPEYPALEWCPPGHGDIYAALQTSDMLRRLLESGKKYAFVSNADNLGASLDTQILGYFCSERIPFMMEVADRTESDKKGGHLARFAGERQQLVLRESAQCPKEDVDFFEDTNRHKYFNTNNLWINLESLALALRENNGKLSLPMIRNSKTLDPKDSSTLPVYQLESAMGAAISVFEGAQALRVPRSRFIPVKTCNDLLVVRSDVMVLTDRFEIRQDPRRQGDPPVVELDPVFYRRITDLEERFPLGPPLLLSCIRLSVEGDILFGNKIAVEGKVKLTNRSFNQVAIPDNTRLTGSQSW